MVLIKAVETSKSTQLTYFNTFINYFFLLQHQQQVALAVDRAKQITITELNAVMQVMVIMILTISL